MSHNATGRGGSRLISDEAPVDNSTLNENGSHYLCRHLEEVFQTMTQHNILVTILMLADYKSPNPDYSCEWRNRSPLGSASSDL
jgi:hypothetical protein